MSQDTLRWMAKDVMPWRMGGGGSDIGFGMG